MKIYFEYEILGERTCFVRLPFIIHYHFYVLDSVEMETNKKRKTEQANKQTKQVSKKEGKRQWKGETVRWEGKRAYC